MLVSVCCDVSSLEKKNFFCQGVTNVIMVGVATDFCVGFSALDSIRAGFQTSVVYPGISVMFLSATLAFCFFLFLFGFLFSGG